MIAGPDVSCASSRYVPSRLSRRSNSDHRNVSARVSNRRPMTRQGTTIPRFNLAAGLSAHLAAGVTVPQE